jgi:hypothetical protein
MAPRDALQSVSERPRTTSHKAATRDFPVRGAAFRVRWPDSQLDQTMCGRRGARVAASQTSAWGGPSAREVWWGMRGWPFPYKYKDQKRVARQASLSSQRITPRPLSRMLPARPRWCCWSRHDLFQM